MPDYISKNFKRWNQTLNNGSGGWEYYSLKTEWRDVLSKPTTLSGYGITDAKIEGGVITLGGSTITPATSGHVHSISLASDSGTPAITLGYGYKYKLTAGGQSVIFGMPASPSTVDQVSHSLQFIDSDADEPMVTYNGYTTTDITLGTGLTINNLGQISVKANTYANYSHDHDDRYLKLSGGLVTGQTTFKTSTNTTPLVIARNESASEGLSIGVNDSEARFVHVQDETTSDFVFVGQFTDTEGGGGANAGSHIFRFNSNKYGPSITVDGTAVSLEGHTHNYIPTSSKGIASGVAELDANGKVPSSQLPSYVDDVVQGYFNTSNSKFYTTLSGTTYSSEITGETGKIYIDLTTNKTYRWSGTAFVEISASLALGTTSSTAFRGDWGASAYAHAVTNKGSAFGSDLYKITTNSEGHVTAATKAQKSDITALGIPGSNTWRPIKVNGTQEDAGTSLEVPINFTGSGATSVSYSNGTVTISSTDNNTTYGGDRGISLSSGNFGHSNTAITAQTTQAVYPIKIDAYGHITSYGTAVTIPTNTNQLTNGAGFVTSSGSVANATTANQVGHPLQFWVDGAQNASITYNGSLTETITIGTGLTFSAGLLKVSDNAYAGYVHDHDDTYLKLTGGTITNTTAPQLVVASTSSGSGGKAGIKFYRGSNTAWEEYIDSGNFYLKECTSDKIALQINEDVQYTGSNNRPLVYGNKLAYVSDIPTNYIPTSSKGSASGVAELDANGKVPSSQLPSYVDDVLEYAATTNFPATGETGKIYVATGTNLTYRWTGSGYTEISPSLALGETSATAYRGDRGASAYAHAVTNKGSAFTSGLYKITTNSEGHVTAATAVVKADITGLGIPGSDTWRGMQNNLTTSSSSTSDSLSAYQGYLLANGSARDSTKLPLTGGTMTGTITTTELAPSADNAYNIGTSSREYCQLYVRAIATRHIDASVPFGDDQRLYIGYGALGGTKATLFYYSANSSSRSLKATVDSNGFTINDKLLPNANNSTNIGTSDKQFANVYTQNIRAATYQVASGTTVKMTMQYNSNEDCIDFVFA